MNNANFSLNTVLHPLKLVISDTGLILEETGNVIRLVNGHEKVLEPDAWFLGKDKQIGNWGNCLETRKVCCFVAKDEHPAFHRNFFENLIFIETQLKFDFPRKSIWFSSKLFWFSSKLFFYPNVSMKTKNLFFIETFCFSSKLFLSSKVSMKTKNLFFIETFFAQKFRWKPNLYTVYK